MNFPTPTPLGCALAMALLGASAIAAGITPGHADKPIFGDPDATNPARAESKTDAVGSAVLEAVRAHYPLRWYELAKANPRPSELFMPPKSAGKLPGYLSMGDSISLCYLPHVREKLADRYAIHRIPHNGAGTAFGKDNIDAYLEAGPFSLITFNWGLHDLIHIKRPNGGGGVDIVHRTNLDEYKKRLNELVAKLKTTRAKLVWVATTPVKDSARYRPEDVDTFNAAAAEVMAANGVKVVDLATSGFRNGPLDLVADGLHFTPESCKVLGETLAGELGHLERLR
ncbi:MAG: SGNH/GDSL hydrolase family protein [Hyphomicrobiaceae bacterium]